MAVTAHRHQLGSQIRGLCSSEKLLDGQFFPSFLPRLYVSILTPHPPLTLSLPRPLCLCDPVLTICDYTWLDFKKSGLIRQLISAWLASGMLQSEFAERRGGGLDVILGPGCPLAWT